MNRIAPRYGAAAPFCSVSAQRGAGFLARGFGVRLSHTGRILF
jgi:hypothetical protein